MTAPVDLDPFAEPVDDDDLELDGDGDDGAVGPDPMDDVDRTVEVLLAGGLVVLPTDTVYGLAAVPTDEGAMDRLFAAKGRGADVPVAVLCADVAQALALADPTSHERVGPVADRWWPGPLTLVLPRREGVALHVGEPASTVGLRVPDDPFVQAVCARVGPIAASSANRHGEPTAVTAEEARLALGAAVDHVVDGGALAGSASTVVDASGPTWRVLREGPIPAAELLHPGDAPLL